MKKPNQVSKRFVVEEPGENLGLDADHSSDGPSINKTFDDDRDRITGNPSGENDEGELDDSDSYTPIDEK
jgi:hypothetical protein